MSHLESICRERAARTSAIVSSIFPGEFRDEMIENQKLSTEKEPKAHAFLAAASHAGIEEGHEKDHLPLAKYYTDVTVMFADIVGFTAWASSKEAPQVFELLETVYNAFDDIATARRVFKVETVGDCYGTFGVCAFMYPLKPATAFSEFSSSSDSFCSVAAAGIPNPQLHHAVVMCRFARNVRSSMNVLKRELDGSLGTSALDLRIGIHSGEVTAGVIRGQKARFQLFGDAVNTCSRIETTGKPGEIHLSSATAALLEASGKAHWIVVNNDCVVAKGKGELKTYWLVSDRAQTSTSASSRSDESSVMDPDDFTPGNGTRKTSENYVSEDHVKWSAEVLAHLLEKIENARGEVQPPFMALAERARIHQMERSFVAGDTVNEFKNILDVPSCPPRETRVAGRKNIQIPRNVVEQLHLYVTCIANMHRKDDRFHTFDHAVRVAHSVRTLMSLWKDPWTPFACVWAALVHHVDHPGHGAVKGTALSAAYGHRAVAEQNALQLSWKLLLDEKFVDLRKTLYRTSAELEYFRQVTVNAVLATDLFDKDLQTIREERWQRASVQSASGEGEQSTNLEATAVMEVVMQASNIAHTMQSWDTYRHWNDRLFVECYMAFQDGRICSDPSQNWYVTEMEFFDKHAIPLSKKLESSLKFLGKRGVGEEYLVSALRNREEWRDKGKSIVSKLLETSRTSSSE